MFASYGHLYRFTRGLIMDAGEEKSEVYVSRSMFAAFDPSTVNDKIKVAECPQTDGYIKRVSYQGLCCMPTEVGGSTSTYYPDYFYTNAKTSKGLRVRAAGGNAGLGANAGAFCTYSGCTATNADAGYSSPLYFARYKPEMATKEK